MQQQVDRPETPADRAREIALRGAWFQRDGVAYVLACLPAVLTGWAYGAPMVLRDARVGVPSAVSTLLLLFGGLLLRRTPRLARLLIIAGVLLLLVTLAPKLVASPAATLAGVVGATFLLFQSFRHPVLTPQRAPFPSALRAYYRARSGGWVALALLVLVTAFHREGDPLVQGGTIAACLVAGLLAWSWSVRVSGRGPRVVVVRIAVALGAVFALAATWGSSALFGAGALWVAAALTTGRMAARTPSTAQAAWEPLLSHPARLLLSTFFGLAVLGTLFLAMPWATTRPGGLATVDAAFTAVSAVCVTGLIVVDTPVDFTLTGQIGILVLIQVGGLGIMSLTTVVLHALGRRMSLRHERVLASMGSESRTNLVRSLRQVVFFAFAAEALGAAVLLGLFTAGGEALGTAVYRAVFTSVSAFCNAGFALQSDSLVAYQGQPWILHVVAALIILGGLSPAVALSLPAALRGRRPPPAAQLVLVVTVLLLFGGWLLYAMFEWNASLGGLSVADRLHNAWFQSVTLRTAGFNSVDIAATRPETRLVMMGLMFIGGSPGGTAGGIKTTTFAVLVLAVATAILGRHRVVVRGRRIGTTTVIRSIAVLGTGVCVWLVTLTALLLTQVVPPEDLVFEVTSALGTVGLSTGATTALDPTGRILVMIAMFLGRVGPLTLFSILGDPRPVRNVEFPEASIPIA